MRTTLKDYDVFWDNGKWVAVRTGPDGVRRNIAGPARTKREAMQAAREDRDVLNGNADCHGLKAGMRVLLTDVDAHNAGEIVSFNQKAGTAWIRFDNGHDAYAVSVDELIPESGW